MNKIILVLILSLSCFIESFSQTETVTASYKYTLGDNDTRNDAKKIAFIEAKRLCIEKVGTYVQGTLKRKVNETIKNGKSELSDVTEKDITDFVGAIVKVDILDENFSTQGESQTLTTTVKAIIDTRNVFDKLREIKGDTDLQEKIKKQQEELEELQKQILDIQKRIAKATPEKALVIREERAETFKEVDQLESVRFEIKRISKLAVDNVDIGMNMDDVKKVAGQPRVTDSYARNNFWNYGNYWVVFSSEIVIAIVEVSRFNRYNHDDDHRRKSIK
jgi:Skp family chaperone for outer membrane proteins